jgi:hypothetical protein
MFLERDTLEDARRPLQQNRAINDSRNGKRTTLTGNQKSGRSCGIIFPAMAGQYATWKSPIKRKGGERSGF